MKPVHGLTLSVLLFSGVLGLAQQQQPSLGEVARQPKPTKKATRVITNEDIPSRPQEEVPPVNSAASAKSSAETKTGDAAQGDKDEIKGAKPGKDESAEVAAMKQRLTELDSDQQNISSSLSELEKSAQSEEDPGRREVLSNMLAKRRESLERAKAERIAIHQKLDEQKRSEQK